MSIPIECFLGRIASLLSELGSLFADGVLHPLPVSAAAMQYAPVAFKHMANARHVGKLVLVPPRSLACEGTVLVTGGLGELATCYVRPRGQNAKSGSDLAGHAPRGVLSGLVVQSGLVARGRAHEEPS